MNKNLISAIFLIIGFLLRNIKGIVKRRCMQVHYYIYNYYIKLSKQVEKTLFHSFILDIDSI